MSTSSIRDLLIEKNGEKILRHSVMRKIIELLILFLFLAIAIIAIVFGSIFTNQPLLFRISLIILGLVILILFGESFLTLMTIQIDLTAEEIKLKRYFKWKIIKWNDIISFELEKRKIKSQKEDTLPRYVSMKIKSSTDTDVIFPLHRFRSKEAYFIVETIKNEYTQHANKELIDENETITINSKPLTEEEITKRIPPKVEEIEIEDD